MNTPPKTPTPHVLHGYCDLCWTKDNHFEGLRLQRCRDCGVSFHCECYGITPRTDHNEKDLNLQCFACQAVGTTVKTRVRDPDTGKRLSLTVTERPTECCLCGVDNENELLHAMHPLFDDHGPCGRQIVLKSTAQKPLRLAWAHTLCCATICTLSGCVYGCTQNGRFVGEEGSSIEEDEEDGNESVNSVLQTPKDGVDCGDITHYVYVHMKNEKRDARYFDYFEHMEKAKQLKCFVCSKNDKFNDVYRLPVKCCANHPKAIGEFQPSHCELIRDTCYQACHVGCAAWYRQPNGQWPSQRHVYFFPGAKSQKPVANVFCTAHARKVQQQADSQGLRYQFIAPANQASPMKLSARDKACTQQTKKRSVCEDSGDTNKTYRRKNESKKVALGFETDTDAHHPAIPPLRGEISSAKTSIEREANLPSGSPTLSSYTESHVTEAKATISESKRQNYDDSQLEQKFLEIVEDIRQCCAQSGVCPDTILRKQKVEWKERLNAPQRLFHSLWSKVVAAVKKDI